MVPRQALAAWRSVLGETQHPLADDVALDLARAARDRVLPGADHTVVPARGVRDVVARLVHEHARPQQLAGEVRDAHAQLRAEQLEDGPLGAGRLAAELPRQVPQPRVLERGGLDDELGEALADERIVPRGGAVDRHLPGQRPEARDLPVVAPSAAPLAL